MSMEQDKTSLSPQRAVQAEDRARGGIVPGKALLTSRLVPSIGSLVQRKAAAAAAGGPPPAVKSAREWIEHPWMDAAHRGTEPAALYSSAPVQAKGAADSENSDDIHSAAAAGVSGAGGALPHVERVQESFGPDHDLSRIEAHVGGAAAAASQAIGAAAYATGNQVAFQAAPDLHTAAHEAAHVVQQQQGVQLQGGVGRIGDSYEHHADMVADRVVAGQSAADLLAASGSTRSPAGDHASSGPVQRTPHYDAIAERIHDAISGPGTDEEAVYLALQPVRGNADAIRQLEAAYLAKYGESLEDAIRDDFSDSELQHCLDLLNPSATPVVGNVYEAAAERIHEAVDVPGTDEEAIFAALEPFGRNTTETQQVQDAYLAKYGEALLARLSSELSGSEYEYAIHLMGGGPSMNTETLMSELGDMEGEQMTWVRSSPGQADLGPPTGVVALGSNDFASWALAATETAGPPVATVTTINCWEMILLAAYNAGILAWQRIHDTYTSLIPAATVAKLRDPDPAVQAAGKLEAQAFIDDLLYTLMTSGSPTDFDKNDPNTPMPNRGDVVFFDGAAHVALATGNGDEIYTFWPPPNTAFTSGGTVDAVKTSTMTELDDWMEAHFGASPHVTFYAPAW